MPVPVALDGDPFAGPLDALYERMRGGGVATTSQPGPAAFLAAYERAASRGAASVLSLHLDGRVSGVAASAALAARDSPIPAEVVDLPTVSFGVTVCIRAAAHALAAGATAAEAAVVARRQAATLDNVFVARAAPEGRLAGAEEWAVLRFADGAQQLVSSQESQTSANAAMARVVGSGRECSVAVGHAASEVEPAADALAHALLREERVRNVERYRVTASVGAHTGPDSYGAFWWPVGS